MWRLYQPLTASVGRQHPCNQGVVLECPHLDMGYLRKIVECCRSNLRHRVNVFDAGSRVGPAQFAGPESHCQPRITPAAWECALSGTMGEMHEIRITDIHDEAAVAELRDQLVIHNLESTGYTKYRPLSCFLRNTECELQAGISGFSWGGYAMIEWLWVSPSLRRAGLGSQLMQAVEAEVRTRGCGVIRVNTHTFQAPDFYRKLGYEQIGYAEDTPIDHGEVFFAKRLARPLGPPRKSWMLN
jgi:ribosomal protein S18 acetylase RimI-like enzyme